MKVALLTREYPPDIYGGAGVHVAYLARELASLVELTVHCEGGERPGAVAHQPWDQLAGANQALRTMSVDLAMTATASGADLVHSHTWYANLAGHLASLLYGVPHVMTVHSLEPLRPWKAEQLGGGYALSSWCEKVAVEAAAAVIAVSDGMRADVLAAYPAVAPERVHVIRNGIDSAEYAPDPGTTVLHRYGVDPARPAVIFVGRITRQKGVPVLLRAAGQPGPGGAARAVRRAAGHRRAGRRGHRPGDQPASVPGRGDLDPGDAAQARGHPAAEPRHRVRLPIAVRAAGHRQPGSDGLRHGGRRHPGGRHPGGGGGRRDRPAGPAGRPGRAGRRAERAGP